MKKHVLYFIVLLYGLCSLTFSNSITSKLIFKRTAERYYQAITKRNRARSGVLLLDDTIVVGAYQAEHAQLFANMHEFQKYLHVSRQAVYHRPWIMSAENVHKVKNMESYRDVINTAFKFGKQ